MNTLLNVYKPIGKTPLEMIHELKQVHPEYAAYPIGYAGRLDPLAHGVLLLMVGEATKNRDAYLGLSKSYEFEILFGVQTDSYDYLGLLNELELKQPASNVNLIVKSFVKASLGKRLQTYPPFSSKTVQGKPLFEWAKEGKIDTIEIPHREIEIYSFGYVSSGTIPRQDLYERIMTNIKRIHGDFRQEEITKRWETFFQTNAQTAFKVAKCKITCSSGTYIRGLVHEVGQQLGCGAIAIDILRTEVGEYRLEDAMKMTA